MWICYFVLLLICCAIGYLIGSINFSLVISRRVYRKDIRRYGSRNAGMTNMLRTFGATPAILTLCGDFCKGVVSILIGRLVLVWILGMPDYQLASGLIGICAMLGHLFPVFYKFKGGKGILVSAGIILMINPLGLCVLLGVFLLFFACSRIISLGSIAAAASFPIVTVVSGYLRGFNRFDFWGSIAVSLVISGLALFMHRGNIVRLIHRQEPKIGKKAN